MKRVLITAVCLLVLASPGMATDKKKVELKNETDKLSYSAGYDMATKIKNSGVELDMNIVVQAVKDVLLGGKTLMTAQEVRDTIIAYQIGKNKDLGEKNRREGAAFLAENRKKEGVTVLPSGLQYKIIAEGKGRSPKAADKVTVHYRGTLIDGSEFDSSFKRGQPVTFALDQVIKGWTEGIQLMKEGGKLTFFIPAELAYGERGTPGGPIGPNAVLTFEVELISVEEQPQAPVQSKPSVTGK